MGGGGVGFRSIRCALRQPRQGIAIVVNCDGEHAIWDERVRFVYVPITRAVGFVMVAYAHQRIWGCEETLACSLPVGPDLVLLDHRCVCL